MRSVWPPLARAARACVLVVAMTPAACFYDSNPGVTGNAGDTSSTARTSSTAPPSSDETATPDETSAATSGHAETGVIPISTTGVDPTTTSSPDETTGCAPQIWYLDADSDGYGATDQATMACEQPTGYVPTAGDCAPMDPLNSPGLPETCDAQDNDCDAYIDEYSPANPTCSGCRGVPSGDRVYYLCSVLRDWSAARTACQTIGPGTDLVVLHSAVEQDTLVAQISAVPDELANAWWIGLSDQGSEGTFVWLDGTSADFTAWLPGEPNQLGEEDCVQYPAGGPGTWNDLDCATPNYSICEGPQ